MDNTPGLPKVGNKYGLIQFLVCHLLSVIVASVVKAIGRDNPMARKKK
jgi:hypothetical protein